MTVVNRSGDFVAVSEEAADLYRYDREEMLNMRCFDLTTIETIPEKGNLPTLFDGSTHEITFEVKLGDGSLAEATHTSEKVEEADCRHLDTEEDYCDVLVTEVDDVTVIEEANESNSDSTMKEVDASAFDEISPEELNQIVKNTRVDAPSGKMPLSKIMLDLAVSHNKIEQYKQGAFSLYDALNQRLDEEQEKNPDSDTAKVLEEIASSAFGMYLRINLGDEELHGERDGEYSDYWN
jgi:hypothetical protein